MGDGLDDWTPSADVQIAPLCAHIAWPGFGAAGTYVSSLKSPLRYQFAHLRFSLLQSSSPFSSRPATPFAVYSLHSVSHRHYHYGSLLPCQLSAPIGSRNASHWSAVHPLPTMPASSPFTWTVGVTCTPRVR